MANRSGVQFGTGASAVAGILDGILQGLLMKRQFQQQDAAEARQERMFSLQERTLEDAERRRREVEFPPPPTTRDVGREVEQSLREKFLASDQAAQEREAVLQQQAFETAKSEKGFQRDITKLQFGIESRGQQARLTKQVPGTRAVKPEVEKTPLEQDIEIATTTRKFSNDIRKSGALPGAPNLTPAELDLRFGEDFLNTAVAKAVNENTPGGVTAVVRDSLASHWASAVVDTSIENDYFDSLPQNAPEDDFEPIAPDVRLKLAADTKQTVVTVNDVRRRFPDFINIPEAGTLDLEELAFIFVSNNAEEQDFRNFIKDVLLERISPGAEQRGEDFRSNLEAGVTSPTTGGTGLGSFK